MDSVSLSLGALGELLGKSTVELESALMTKKENSEELVLIDQVNIDKYVSDAFRNKLVAQKGSGKDDFISYGKKSAFDEIESFLTENHGVSKGTKWKDGIETIITSAKEKAQTTDEAVKGHKLFKDLQEKVSTAEQALQNAKAEFRGEKIKTTLSNTLKTVLSDEKLGLALPDDEAIRTNQLESFNSFIAGKATLTLNDKGELIPVGADGKQLEDTNFNPVSLNTFITQHAKGFWPSKPADPGRTAPPVGEPGGNPPPNPDGGGPVVYPKFKDANELSEFTDKALSEGKPADFIEGAAKAFESQN